MRLTRRQLAAAALAPAALAQTSAPATASDELNAAQRRLKANSEALSKIQVPIETEPAFQFKA